MGQIQPKTTWERIIWVFVMALMVLFGTITYPFRMLVWKLRGGRRSHFNKPELFFI